MSTLPNPQQPESFTITSASGNKIRIPLTTHESEPLTQPIDPSSGGDTLPPEFRYARALGREFFNGWKDYLDVNGYDDIVCGHMEETLNQMVLLLDTAFVKLPS